MLQHSPVRIIESQLMSPTWAAGETHSASPSFSTHSALLGLHGDGLLPSFLAALAAAPELNAHEYVRH